MKWNIITKILNFDISGEYNKVREHMAARSRRRYPTVPPTVYAPFVCIVVDMITVQKESIDGAIYAHNFKDKQTKMAWSYPVVDASADTFLVVLKDLLARLHRFRVGIIRADAGSNYTATKVRTFCESKGIKLEIAVVKAPHQIQIAERNHDILLSTMRALMSFANAPYRLWANCIVWSCMLHNVSAVDYKTSEPIIPYHATDQPIDKNLLLPFGCLVVVHRDKDQVKDGKLDQRGQFGAFIGLADRFEFKKGIKVMLPGDVIVETCFFTSDETYFPWRPAGQRRLLRDGTFGQELETNAIFRGELDFDERLLISKKMLEMLDRPSGEDLSDDDDELLMTPAVVDATSRASDGAASSASDVSHASIDLDLELLNKQLVPGDRIIFVFHPPHNECFGVYVSKGLRKSDRANDLCRVRWDDAGNELAQLSDARRFKGTNLNDIDAGQWAIVASKSSVIDDTSYIFAAHAQVENNIFIRDFNDIPDGDLFIPSTNIDDANHGPFTEAQVQKQDAWPEWKAAGDTEINQIAERDVFDLVDEKAVKRLGFFVFPSRFVYTVSSKGSRKARLVVRGDYQVFGDSLTDLSDDQVEY
jgi:hypothetical protein